MPVVAETIDFVRRTIADLSSAVRNAGETPRVVLIPTMGALHAGHVTLVERARDLGNIVVVSIFVNPLQFGPTEDLDRYPRTIDADVLALEGLADIVFAPTAAEMYPNGPTETRVAAGPVGDLFEGASRPGHFDGVLTVVAKLFNIVSPQVAVFGQKDAQQAFLVTQMVEELDFDLVIEQASTVREDDGLALSSRNRFLDTDSRRASVALSRGLAQAASLAESGRPLNAVIAAARAVIEQEPAVKMDYLAAVDPATFLPLAAGTGGATAHPAILIVAAAVGTTRLIDNKRIILHETKDAPHA